MTRRYRIVAGVDLSEYSEIVIEHALDQAARHHAPEIHFVHVKEKKKLSSDALKHRLSTAVYPALQTFNQYGTDWRARLHVRTGKPHEQIASLAADLRADMIVVGQFGLHNPRTTIKTVPGRLLAQAPCPTLVVGMPKEHDTTQCDACLNVRDHSEGERWFCDDHTGDRGFDHVVTPMTTWTGGTAMW